jgi:hypothetical protein
MSCGLLLALFLENRVYLEFNSYDLSLCLLLRLVTVMYALKTISLCAKVCDAVSYRGT